MATLPLQRSLEALIDNEDYIRLKHITWYLSVRGYVMRSNKFKEFPLYLHQNIIQVPKGMHTDHINGDKLDNRRANLRMATASQNGANSKSDGVSLRKDTGKWRSRITINRKEISLGNFDTREEAIEAHNIASKKYFGEFARMS